MDQAKAIWVYDSVCVLCSRGVQYTLKHEKVASIKFVAIQSDEGRLLAQTNGIDPDDPTTFLFIENGQALEKSDAIIALSKHLNGPARITPILKVMPKVLRDAAYLFIARHRYRVFGKTDLCMVPPINQRERFVL
jgi:predicted DCC family thiol-disulfide oxidoreductase YuxK